MKISTLNQLEFKNYKGIIFDCFGTLLKINKPTYPYLKILKKIRSLNKHDYTEVLKKKLFLKDLNDFFNAQLSNEIIQQAELELKLELESITIYPEVLITLENLIKNNIKILICSNLAYPYGKKIKQLPIKDLVLSYEVGYIKPETEIYKICSEKLELNYSEILFVGNNLISDYQKPMELGINSVLINRN